MAVIAVASAETATLVVVIVGTAVGVVVIVGMVVQAEIVVAIAALAVVAGETETVVVPLRRTVAAHALALPDAANEY